MTWIEDAFPGLRGSVFDITSPPADYNCIAYAAGDESRWWSHLTGYYWPAERLPRIEALRAVFETLGYALCDNGELEDGYEKVALYAKGVSWTHASRQLPTGQWTSKLGRGEDIIHPTAQILEGREYGLISCFMRRVRS